MNNFAINGEVIEMMFLKQLIIMLAHFYSTVCYSYCFNLYVVHQ